MFIFLCYSLNFYYCFNSYFFAFWYFCLLSRNTMFSVFTDVVAWISASFLSFFLTEYYSICRSITFSLSIHQLMAIWVVYTFFIIMSNAAMNMSVQVLVWTYVFSSLRYNPGNENAGSFGRSVLNFLSNCPTVFKGVTPFCILISSLLGFHFSCNLLTQLSIFFYYCSLSGCEVVSHWVICISTQVPEMSFFLSFFGWSTLSSIG